MNIIIDIEDSAPIFTQLIGQIKNLVLTGGIEPGDPLPSIRQLANDLGINNKTVVKAYNLLERDSVIQSKGYRGTFVHKDAKNNCTINLNDMVIARLDETIIGLKELGATDSEIRIAFGNVMNKRKS